MQELRATLLACGLRVVDSLGNLVTHLDECVLTLGADKVGSDGSSRRRRLFGAAGLSRLVAGGCMMVITLREHQPYTGWTDPAFRARARLTAARWDRCGMLIRAYLCLIAIDATNVLSTRAYPRLCPIYTSSSVLMCGRSRFRRSRFRPVEFGDGAKPLNCRFLGRVGSHGAGCAARLVAGRGAGP